MQTKPSRFKVALAIAAVPVLLVGAQAKTFQGFWGPRRAIKVTGVQTGAELDPESDVHTLVCSISDGRGTEEEFHFNFDRANQLLDLNWSSNLPDSTIGTGLHYSDSVLATLASIPTLVLAAPVLAARYLYLNKKEREAETRHGMSRDWGEFVAELKAHVSPEVHALVETSLRNTHQQLVAMSAK